MRRCDTLSGQAGGVESFALEAILLERLLYGIGEDAKAQGWNQRIGSGWLIVCSTPRA
jgi:hypothetical protein